MNHLKKLVDGGMEKLEPTPQVVAAYILGARHIAGKSLKYKVTVSPKNLNITFDWSLLSMILQRVKDFVIR
jgi:hypothetical protein